MLLKIKIKNKALTNKYGGHKKKEIFNELAKERFDKIIELTYEINQNNLIYNLKLIVLERDLMISIMV